MRIAAAVLISLNKHGRFPYDKLITPFPLESVNEALGRYGVQRGAGEPARPVRDKYDFEFLV